MQRNYHILPLSFNDDDFYQLTYTLKRFLEYAFTLVKKQNINFCYIGTALHDQVTADGFFTAFAFSYFSNLNILINSSKLTLTTKPNMDEVENKLRKQDIIFIGGGDTEFMLKTWKETGFEDVLIKLKNEGCLPVIMGLSAGGSFPFQAAISLTANNQEYKVLQGYHWLNGSFTPHSTCKIEADCTFDKEKKNMIACQLLQLQLQKE